jgi:hypothetical protein
VDNCDLQEAAAAGALVEGFESEDEDDEVEGVEDDVVEVDDDVLLDEPDRLSVR